MIMFESHCHLIFFFIFFYFIIIFSLLTANQMEGSSFQQWQRDGYSPQRCVGRYAASKFWWVNSG